MAKKKYYAVKKGKKPGIYQTWAETEEQTNGFPGSVFKAFPTLDEAEGFLTKGYAEDRDDADNKDIKNEQTNQIINNLDESKALAILCGRTSCDSKGVTKLGYGGVLKTFDAKEIIYKAFVNHKDEGSGSIVAEVEAVKEVILWAISSGKVEIDIIYNLEGIEKWISKEWKPKKIFSIEYSNFVEEKSKLIKIKFLHSKPYKDSELYYEADSLAKKALLEKGYKTYSDGSIYFSGYNVEDWSSILTQIETEAKALNEDCGFRFSINKSQDYKKVIKVMLNKNNLTINCYRNNTSYVQGKQSELFEMIISLSIERLTNKSTVIETLNSYRATSIECGKLENRLDNLLPNFPKDTLDTKIYNNMLSAVHNTMLVGYMPDYTSLIHPVFRGSEYYLHRILGDELGLETEIGSTNNFGYFNRDLKTGKYYCPKAKVLVDEQANLLNDIYNYYNQIRHPCSHWAKNSMDTKVITSMKEAREIIFEAFILFDKYYILFKTKHLS